MRNSASTLCHQSQELSPSLGWRDGLLASWMVLCLLVGPQNKQHSSKRAFAETPMHASEMRRRTVEAPSDRSIFVDKRQPASPSSPPAVALSPTRAKPSSASPVTPKIFWPTVPHADADHLAHIGGSAGLSSAYAHSRSNQRILCMSTTRKLEHSQFSISVLVGAGVCAARPRLQLLRHGRYRPASRRAAGALPGRRWSAGDG